MQPPLKKQTVLITGAAGFIGHALTKKLLGLGAEIIGIDDLNYYYTVALKEARLAELRAQKPFTWFQGSILDKSFIDGLFKNHKIDCVIHLAAQPGVRYSMEQPQLYVDTNISGVLNILEACRHHPVSHLLYASSSSVYGGNTTLPYAADALADHPVSLYAATKKAGELLAHSYSAMHNIPITGLRFFTVYGPWGRPDMAYFKFARAMLKGEPINVYNHGDMKRDFTYIDDVVDGVIKLIPLLPERSAVAAADQSAVARHRIYNVGNHTPEPLMKLITLLEKELNCKANMVMQPMQLGDMPATWAEVTPLANSTGFSPNTPLETGIARFADWLKKHPEFI